MPTFLIWMLASPAFAFDSASFYSTTCASCHGVSGGGDGPVGAALPVKPASFRDPAFWASRDHARVKKAIAEGGPAVGASPLMAPFGASLSSSDLDALVGYLHSFAPKQAAPAPMPAPKPKVSPKPKASPKPPPPKPAPVPQTAPAPAPDHTHTSTPASPPPEPSPPEEDSADVHDNVVDDTVVDDTVVEVKGAEDAAVEDAVAEVEVEEVEEVEVVHYPRPEVDAKQGRRLYSTQCASCHGNKGNGRGPAARFMDPAPRDFTTGVYKFTSTPLGQGPTEEDLFRTITRGMPGTSMPAWAGLSVDQRWQLVYHLRTLDPPPESTPFEVPTPPPTTSASVAHGAEVYATNACAACHGPTGRARGMPKLSASNGTPIRAADLTRSDRFRGGARATDIYRTLTAGIGGTPMPSFGHLSVSDRWDLVHWIQANQRGGSLF